MEDTTERENRSLSPEFSPKSPQQEEGTEGLGREEAMGTFDTGEDVEGDWTEKLAVTVAEGRGESMAKADLALMKHSSSNSESVTVTAPAAKPAATTTATAVTTVTATVVTTPTADVQTEKDAFTKALSEKKGNTLLLTMWESGKPCEPMAKNERGQEVDFDLVEMRTGEVQIATTTGGSETRRMVLTAWTGTDITRAERKNKADANNYIVVILKKEEVQTWGDVEIHLWREYRRDWNTNK